MYIARADVLCFVLVLDGSICVQQVASRGHEVAHNNSTYSYTFADYNLRKVKKK